MSIDIVTSVVRNAGVMVLRACLFDPGAKRESGEPTIGKTGAAPATVSGEPLSNTSLE
ncbi:hypothetical protein L905_26265 [Agrobacterium sp. TS43]|nr:hypothetical protein L905_26265 [Agrobacterium sp. TS43]